MVGFGVDAGVAENHARWASAGAGFALAAKGTEVALVLGAVAVVVEAVAGFAADRLAGRIRLRGLIALGAFTVVAAFRVLVGRSRRIHGAFHALVQAVTAEPLIAVAVEKAFGLGFRLARILLVVALVIRLVGVRRGVVVADDRRRRRLARVGLVGRFVESTATESGRTQNPEQYLLHLLHLLHFFALLLGFLGRNAPVFGFVVKLENRFRPSDGVTLGIGSKEDILQNRSSRRLKDGESA
ncbi:MAG: hypothetical protein AAB444_02800 [Patescibacteria group bacterium]